MTTYSCVVSGLAWVACATAALSFGQAQTTYKETVLHNFALQRQPKGVVPFAGVVRDSAGNLYGTADQGGVWNNGTVFRVDPPGNLTVLYSFAGEADGGRPAGGVIRDDAGNLYGTTEFAGDFSSETCGPNPAQGCGVIYKIDPSGHKTVLHAFAGPTDGAYPVAGLVRDAAGNLYGTASYGGALDAGTVFKLSAAGQFTLLYTFTGGADGNSPSGTLVLDQSGNLYGTAEFGGRDCSSSLYGLVYRFIKL